MNNNEKVTIFVSSRPDLDSQGWFHEKSNLILEELSYLAEILRSPKDEPTGEWSSKQEEIDFHLTQAVRNALKIASLSSETECDYCTRDVDRIIDGGHDGYLQYRNSKGE